MGELLAQMDKNKGARSQSHPKTGGNSKRPPVKDTTPKLSDLGVSKHQSSRWQKLADLPNKEFDAHVAKIAKMTVAAAEGDKAFLREARAAAHADKRKRREERERDLAAATEAASQELGKKLYGVVYADAPWRYEGFDRDTSNVAPDHHYPTMTLERSCHCTFRRLMTACFFSGHPSHTCQRRLRSCRSGALRSRAPAPGARIAADGSVFGFVANSNFYWSARAATSRRLRRATNLTKLSKHRAVGTARSPTSSPR
jgi:hypothetical protein